MPKNKLARTLKREFDTKEDHYDRVAAQLGNETGTVEITGRVNYHYARIAGQGKAFPVFNVRTAAIPDLWVWVGFDPDDPTTPWQVLGKIGGKLDYGDNNAGSTLPLHAESHRFLGLGARGGLDTLWVELRQFMPFRVGPSSGLNVVVYRGVAWTGTQFIEVPAETIDLTSLVPSTSNQAIFVLVTVDNTGDIITTAGSEVDFDTLTELDIPAIPAYTKYVLAAVRLYEGQDTVYEGRTNTDIFDLRFAWVSSDVVDEGGPVPAPSGESPITTVGDMIYGDDGDISLGNVAIWENGIGADATASSTNTTSPPTGGQPYHILQKEDIGYDNFQSYGWKADAINEACYDEWIYIDLGVQKTIKSLYYSQYPASYYTGVEISRIRQFKVWKSDNAVDWTEIATVNIGDPAETYGDPDVTYNFATSQTARYFKFAPTLMWTDAMLGSESWVIYRIYLYESDSGVIETRLPIGAEGEVLMVISGKPSWEEATGGHEIQDEGTPLTQRAALNFVGAGVTVTDDAGNDASVVSIGDEFAILEYSEADVSNPPTESELITAFGSPADFLADKKIGILNDANLGLNVYNVISVGGHYWLNTLAKAVSSTPSLGTVTETDIAAPASGEHYSRANVQELSDGTWVLVYREGSDHAASNDGQIHIRFSDDYGATWTAEDTYLDGNPVSEFPTWPTGAGPSDPTWDAGIANLVLAPDGTLFCHIQKADYNLGTYDGLYELSSTDGGASWSVVSTVTFNSVPGGALGNLHGDYFIFDGNIYAVGGYSGNDSLFKSTDNGASWTYISTIAAVGEAVGEPCMEYVGSNTIIVVFRDNANTVTKLTKSTDMGATWAALTDITSAVGGVPLGRPMLYTRSHLKGLADWWNDSVLIMCGFELTTPGSSHERRNAVWVSQDKGDTWTGPLYTDTQQYDGGYGDMAYDPVNDKYVFISYYGPSLLTATVVQYKFTINNI